MSDHTRTSRVEQWASGAFLDEASAWVEDRARAAGVVLTGEREQPHNRPWSTAVRFGAVAGDLWFKADGPGTLHEGAVVAAIHHLEPGLVPEVLGVDVGRGWFLTRDAGPMLRATATPDELWEPWAALLARYAEAQVRLAAHGGAFAQAGLPEVSPTTLPDRFRALLEELGGRDPEDGGLTREQHTALTALLPGYDDACAELAASGIPDTVQHDDLHSGNVCWGGSVADARLIDWGDASWGCPLGTMLCTVNSVAWHAGCRRDDPRVRRVLDAYLEPFTRYAEPSALRRYVALARRTGRVTRALSYRAALEGEPVRTARELDFPVRDWLLDLLEPAPDPA